MSSTPAEQKAAARQFAEFWRGKGYEKGQPQPFWIGLLKVLGVAELFKRYQALVEAKGIKA